MFATASFNATDPDDYASMIRGAQIDVVLAERGDFAASATRVDLGLLWIQQGHESMARTFRAVIPVDRVVMWFLKSSQPSAKLLSATVANNDLAVMSPGEAASWRTSAPCAWSSMSLPTDAFRRYGVSLCGRDVMPDEVQNVVQPSAQSFDRLRRLHSAICDIAETAPLAASHPDAARGLQQHMISAAFTAISEGVDQASVKGHHIQGIMARFEDLIEAHPKRAIYLAEVCEAVGVTPRAFNNYCHDYLGMNPTRYLTLRRMHQVYRGLRAGDAAFTSVTELATQHGFWELGRFSVAYRRLFGESPSVTLHRTPQDSRLLDTPRR